MQTVILAAGMGLRLGSLTKATPKALIEVDGKPLIQYALRFARMIGADHVVVVGGFHYADLMARVTSCDAKAVPAENHEFRKGNLLSLKAGWPALDRSAGYLVMNTDHIYRPSIAEIVAQAVKTATEVTAFCDFDRTLTADDMKVRLDDERRVSEISKTLETWDAGYVGMTYVPARRVSVHTEACDTVNRAQGETVHVESVLAHLARTGCPPHIADISGHGWLEVDEPHERDDAEQVLRVKHWWQDLVA